MDFRRWTTLSTIKRTQPSEEKAKTATLGRPSINSVREDLELAWKKQRLLTFEDFASRVAIGVRTIWRRTIRCGQFGADNSMLDNSAQQFVADNSAQNIILIL